jgi:DNA modification methylase
MKINEVHGRFGKVIFQDCLIGLKQLPDQSFDLGLTDPDWLIDYNKKTRKHHGRKVTYDKKVHYYHEKGDFNWVREWFSELERVCKGIGMCIGSSIYLKWVKEIPAEPIGTFIRYYRNGQNSTKLSMVSGYTPYIFYGKLNKRLKRDIFYRTKHWGFLNDDRHILKHPTPRDEVVLMKIIKETESKSVIDPFMGSGTCAEACETLGVKYQGFELNNDYVNDIEFKITRGIKNYKGKQQIKKLSEY